MAYQNLEFHKLNLLLLLVSVLLLHSSHVRGRSLEVVDEDHSAPPEGTVKTIKGDNGEMVDCVDIYNQPAFSHSLLKNHKIRMDHKTMKRSKSIKLKLTQPWHKNGMCSEGTIPIRRRQLQGSNPPTTQSTATKGPHFEYAVVRAFATNGTKFNGGFANLSIWNPFISSNDSSASSLLVMLNPETFLEAGWIVDFEKYHDFSTRLFMYTQMNNTSCWDLHCNGFVQFSNTVALGSPITSISTIGAATQFILEIVIYRSERTGDWVLSVQGDVIGYWPASLFTGLSEGAERLRWGGTIYDSVGGDQHTSTDMGNGLFPDSGTNEASYVCGLTYIDDSFDVHYTPRSMLKAGVTNPSCYDVRFIPDSDDGPCFLFGGPGRNSQCP